MATTKTPIPDLAVNPFAFEVFDVVTKQRTKARKVEALKKFEHPSLKALFIWNFDETIVSLLPEGDVPFPKRCCEFPSRSAGGTLAFNVSSTWCN